MPVAIDSSATAPAPDDGALVRRILDGDQSAFETVMRRHNRMLFRTARAMLRSDADAEDALQVAYLQAYRALPGFRGDARLSTWLARIVINEATARRRRYAAEARVIPLDSATDDDGGLTQALADSVVVDADAPEPAAMRGETRALLERRIDALPEQFRAVFVLRAVEELSVEETAATLGIPAATVRTRFFRARSLLRESLAREFDVALESAFGFDGARCDRMVEVVMRLLRTPHDPAPPGG